MACVFASALEQLKQYGYVCYVDRFGNKPYGFLITPNDNVMYIEYTDIKGWHVNLCYKPKRETGSGCSAENCDFTNLTVDNLKLAEKNCLQYARILNAEFYKNSKAWYNLYWNKNNLILL